MAPNQRHDDAPPAPTLLFVMVSSVNAVYESFTVFHPRMTTPQYFGVASFLSQLGVLGERLEHQIDGHDPPSPTDLNPKCPE